MYNLYVFIYWSGLYMVVLKKIVNSQIKPLDLFRQTNEI